MFEGDGAHVSTNKFVPYQKLFQDGYFIIASNDTPLMSVVSHHLHATSWVPMMSRTQLVSLEIGHEGVTKFPYTKE